MDNKDKKRKRILYISIAIIVFLIISVIYFMVATKKKEKKYNEDMAAAITNIADNIVYDYIYSDENIDPTDIKLFFDVNGKIFVGKLGDTTDQVQGTLILIYDGKHVAKVILPEPVIMDYKLNVKASSDEGFIEQNRAISDKKIEIEDEFLSSGAKEVLTDRLKAVLTEYLKAKGYKDIEFK